MIAPPPGLRAYRSLRRRFAHQHHTPLPAYVKMLRALVKLNLTRPLVSTLADDIAGACETLAKKGGASKAEREQVKTGVGY